HPRDAYEAGEAFLNGEERVAYDLDMMIVEYEHPATDWAHAITGRNLVTDGDFEKPSHEPSATSVPSGLRTERSTERGAHSPKADTDAVPDLTQPAGWTRFAVDPGTAWWYMSDPDGNRYPRILGGSVS